MKNKWRRISKRIIPLILVCSLTIGLIFGTNTKEVKAVAGVDDALVVIALLAMCGVAYTGINYAWHGGQGWVNDGDVEFPDADTTKWRDGFNEKWQKQWDEDVKKEALEKGLIDENDNITTGGSGGGDDGDDGDDDNKFPSWEKVVNLASTQKNISLALSAYLPFIALFGYETYKDSINAKDISKLEGLTKGNELLDKYISDNNLDFSSYPYYLKLVNTWGSGYRLNYYVFPDAYQRIDATTFTIYPVYTNDSGKSIEITIYSNGTSHITKSNQTFSSGNFTIDGPLFYSTNVPQKDVDGNLLPVIISPDTIGSNSALDDYLKNNNELPDSVINNTSRVPTDEEFAQYLKDLKNSGDDEYKKKGVIDDFIKKLTAEQETPTPTPTPSPTPTPGGSEVPTPSPSPGGDSGNTGGSETPDNPSQDTSDNESFTRDLKTIFPFCIPFDIVDCIKLFNAEPETPRVEVPMHFGIVNKDYTWVIDLKDFDGVALIFRTMFLIVFLIGLAITTSKVIKW